MNDGPRSIKINFRRFPPIARKREREKYFYELSWKAWSEDEALRIAGTPRVISALYRAVNDVTFFLY